MDEQVIDNRTSEAINGDLKIGDWVISISEDNYGYLVGKVTAIGDHDLSTYNAQHYSEIVFVNLTAADYSEQRIAEIERDFSKSYKRPMRMSELFLDDVRMSATDLIRIPETDHKRIEQLTGSLAGVNAYIDEFIDLNSGIGLIKQADLEPDLNIKLYAWVEYKGLHSTTLYIPYNDTEREYLTKFLTVMGAENPTDDLHIIRDAKSVDVTVRLSSTSDFGKALAPLFTENDTISEVNALCSLLRICSEERLADIYGELVHGNSSTIKQMLDALKSAKAAGVAEEHLVAETVANTESENERENLFEEIAKKHCHIETLQQRYSDNLDFHDVSVWGLRAALEAAYNAGISYEKDQTKTAEQDTPSVMDVIRKAKKESRDTPSTKSAKSKGKKRGWEI
ncbi:MAG: hypothetical protein LBN00_04945 [Oscillospiraceae bacterium]|jgi:hypothetical protein|nr:hypothetical protein [Oscillospiraceae bacterium]